MSLRIRFMILIGVLSLLAILGISVASYKFSINNAMTEARAKGRLVFNFLESARLHFKKVQRPKILELAGPGHRVPVELKSGFALTRGVWAEFEKKVPDYAFRQATPSPLNPANKADSDDMKIIAAFRSNPDTKSAEGLITRKGEPYYYFAHPIYVSQSCLRCHGDPAEAPQWQKDQYGTDQGYNWKAGQVASAYVVYVPLKKALAQAKKSAVNLVLIGVVCILVFMLVIWFFFSRYIITPVSMLEKRATEISLGKNLSEPIRTPSQDEIGSLARSVDRLRISVEKLLQRLRS
ncbi:DUF3365 domain-containing protein [Thermodesulfobacteriota bacterium B35]